ncbi:MAG: PepSY domain-containing protein [Anaerolineaceae bacterium]
MNKSLTIALAVIGGLVIIALIFGTGLFVGRIGWGMMGYGPSGMMGLASRNNRSGYSMMGNGYTGMGYGGMMGGSRSGITASVKPLTIEQARQAVEEYLKGLNNPDLELKEIMIFDNNAYARVTEKSTGIGAMELLVDPASLAVFPEYGPNMMWNLKYGHMAGFGGMMGGFGRMMGGGGMMRGLYTKPGTVSATMPVTPEQAVTIAQQYLDQEFPGYKAATDPDQFYGYYTIEILKDGQPTGMLSVNGSSGQVFLHTWHGKFIELSE